MEPKDFANQLISWYDHHRRELPWRNTRDPYKIWLSEIILQQTRVKQGLPYYERFVEQYPSVHDLAAASEEEVLRLWQGLGYYSRARNLHNCAKMIVEEYQGQFPGTFEELLKLKGVGNYTAAAIASFAFDQPAAVVDGNVYRVLARVFGIDTDIASSKGAKEFQQLANELIDPERPGVYNQAIMEFGAMQCSPASPACALCPVSESCYAFNHNAQQKLPVKLKKTKVRDRHFFYLVIEDEEGLWMKQRGPKDVWQSLYDFKLVEFQKPVEIEKALEAVPLFKKKGVFLANESKIYKHILSHQRIFAQFLRIRMKNHSFHDLLKEDSELNYYTFDQVKALPKPILINNYLEEHIF